MLSPRSTMSDWSRITTDSLRLIIEKLKCHQNRETTKANYLGIWHHFNQFLMKLDVVPDDWEDRTSLFCAHLVNLGRESSTIKSCVSAIKCVLKNDSYDWDNNQLLLRTITRGCKIINDKYHERLPIKRNLLEVILFELGRTCGGQPYLLVTYRALFALTYYRLF